MESIRQKLKKSCIHKSIRFEVKILFANESQGRVIIALAKMRFDRTRRISMEFFEKQINRKTFVFMFVLLIIFLTFARIMIESNSDIEVTAGIMLALLVVIVYSLTIHFRGNHINGESNIWKTIKYIILSFLPLIGFVTIVWLACTEGAGSTIITRDENNRKDNFAVVKDLQRKYSGQLANSNELLDNDICQDLYRECNNNEEVRKIIINYNLGVNDIVDFYKTVKSGDILWDDNTGIYLPFSLIVYPKTLLAFIENKHLPAMELKALIMNEINQKTLTMSKNDYYATLHRITSDKKKMWILIFLVVSVCMMLYPPYHTVMPNKGDEFVGYSLIGTFPEKTTKATRNFTSVDYVKLAFHEVIWAVTCCAGYTFMTTTKR